jgi:hypothetical protein
MDDIEYADQQYQTLFNSRIKAIREQKLVMSNPSKICWSCEAETESEQHRWCSVECTNAWSRENE